MSRETATWLNAMTLIGYTDQRGHAWHYRAGEQGVAFLFKQWGGPRPNSGGRLLDGRTWDELPTPVSMSADPPADLLIREFPA